MKYIGVKSSKGHRHSGTIFLFLLILIPWGASSSAVSDLDTIMIRGLVTDQETSYPVDNASVKVWRGSSLIAQDRTDAEGSFAVQIPKGYDYIVYVYADTPSTPGWDYLPAFEEILSSTNDVNLTMELRQGGSVIIDQDIQFLDMTSQVTVYTWEVREPGSGEAMDINGYRPIYGTPKEAHTTFLGLDKSQLIVPAGVPFEINSNSVITIEGKRVTRSFVIDEPGHLNLSQGDLIHLDVRKYSLQYDKETIDEKRREVEARTNEMEGMGFYLFLEKQKFVEVSLIVNRAESNLFEGSYRDSFTEFRRAYIEITDLSNSLNYMYKSAATSVLVLMFFLALTSMTIAFLLFENPLRKTVASGGLTAIFHIVLHEIYPGVAYIPVETFIGFSAFSWCATVVITAVSPRLLKGHTVGGITPVRNIVVPIFSIAKRGLTRRRFRFMLTLTSITFLVMSFVTLTSFSMGYGLIQKPISSQPIPIDGIIMRAAFSSTEWQQPSFVPLEATAIDWLQEQSEVEFVAPKAENQPSLKPILRLDGRPIYGIIGVEPEEEAQVSGLDGILAEGRYLRDSDKNAILISVDLSEELDVEIDETLQLGDRMVRLVGIFRDERLRELRDLDGETMVPLKLVNLNPPGEPSNIKSSPVETDEIVICDLETALELPTVFISRVNAILVESESVNDFAVRAALERNYQVKASSEEGLYIARLGTQFQGKGLPLAVPWGIVVLNVVVTMLNSLYERKREIHILSSVGLNPSHIGGIFIAEAMIIGFIGGGVGYLLGLGLYKVLALAGITLGVRQKVSALWCFGALATAMATVVIGAVLAIKSSVIITPSLMRIWRFRAGVELGEPIEMTLPIDVPTSMIEDFMDYVYGTLKTYERDPTTCTERVKMSKEEDELGSYWSIKFSYRKAGGLSLSGSFNTLIAQRLVGKDAYGVRMISTGDKAFVHKTGSLVRLIIMRWSTSVSTMRAPR